MTAQNHRAAQRAAAILGSITSRKKAAAARRNGRLGGRPRKQNVTAKGTLGEMPMQSEAEYNRKTKQSNKETKQ